MMALVERKKAAWPRIVARELDKQSSESEGNSEEYDHESSSSEDETTNINENGKRRGHYMRGV